MHSTQFVPGRERAYGGWSFQMNYACIQIYDLTALLQQEW